MNQQEKHVHDVPTTELVAVAYRQPWRRWPPQGAPRPVQKQPAYQWRLHGHIFGRCCPLFPLSCQLLATLGMCVCCKCCRVALPRHLDRASITTLRELSASTRTRINFHASLSKCRKRQGRGTITQPFCPGKGCGAETSLIWAGHYFASRLETSKRVPAGTQRLWHGSLTQAGCRCKAHRWTVGDLSLDGFATAVLRCFLENQVQPR